MNSINAKVVIGHTQIGEHYTGYPIAYFSETPVEQHELHQSRLMQLVLFYRRLRKVGDRIACVVFADLGMADDYFGVNRVHQSLYDKRFGWAWSGMPSLHFFRLKSV